MNKTVSRVMVTGGASGIGLEASLQLAQRGHHIIIADRNDEGGKAVVDRIVDAGGSGEFRQLDLGDLSFIREFAAGEVEGGQPLNILINNAGLLPPMQRQTTRDGFELEFGVAHLGHFALTGLLLPALRRAAAPRVVNVSSLSHTHGQIDFDDLQHERGYVASRAYTCTKLACLMFALELNRRAGVAGADLISVAAHPGVARTPIAAGWDAEDRRRLWDRFERAGYHIYMRLFGRSAERGAEPLVYAATDAAVGGGGYYGPSGFQQSFGPPGRVKPGKQALDIDVAAQLWEESERLTGVRYAW